MEKTKPKFSDLISNSDVPVLVDFFAEWCGPCKTMTPVIADIATEFQSQIKVIKVDVDKNPSVSTHFKIAGVPTLILFNKGEIRWRQSGAVPGYIIKQAINQNL